MKKLAELAEGADFDIGDHFYLVWYDKPIRSRVTGIEIVLEPEELHGEKYSKVRYEYRYVRGSGGNEACWRTDTKEAMFRTLKEANVVYKQRLIKGLKDTIAYSKSCIKDDKEKIVKAEAELKKHKL